MDEVIYLHRLVCLLVCLIVSWIAEKLLINSREIFGRCKLRDTKQSATFWSDPKPTVDETLNYCALQLTLVLYWIALTDSSSRPISAEINVFSDFNGFCRKYKC